MGRDLRIPDHEYVWKIARSPEDLEEVRQALAAVGTHYFDVETSSLRWWRDDCTLTGLGIGVFAGGKLSAWYIPVRHVKPEGQQSLLGGSEDYSNVDLATAVDLLRPFLEDPEKKTVTANGKFEYHIMLREGVTLAGLRDVQPSARILRPHLPRVGLKVLMLAEFGVKAEEKDHLTGWAKSNGIRVRDGFLEEGGMPKCPVDLVGEYCCADVRWTCLLHLVLMRDLRLKPGLMKLWKMEQDLVGVTARMEETGWPIDKPFMEAALEKIRAERASMEEEIFTLAGARFNLDAPEEKAIVLYDRLKLPVMKLTKGGKDGKQKKRSVDKEALEKLRGKHPIVELLEAHASQTKLETGFLVPLLEKAHLGPDGEWRVYPSFHQSGTHFGRYSSSDPNGQNMPRGDLTVRRGFIPPAGPWRHLRADYSQVEYLLLAHFSEEPRLLEVFRTGGDVHQETADVIQRDRYTGKTVNFTDMYGGGAAMFAATAKISLQEAKSIQAAKRKAQPYVEKLKTTVAGVVKKHGGIKNPFGLTLSVDKDHGYIGMNGVVQSTAALIAKVAMVRVDWLLRDRKSRLAGMIHDDLIFEWHDEDADLVWPIMQLMTDFPGPEGYPAFLVPLSVDVKVSGHKGEDHGNWADSKEVKAKGWCMTALVLADERLEKAHPERWKQEERSATITAVRGVDPVKEEELLKTNLKLLHSARTGTGQATLLADVEAYEEAVTAAVGVLS